VAGSVDPVPLAFAMPPATLVLREAAATLTERLVNLARAGASGRDDPDADAVLALLLNNLANRLSDLGRREDALAAAEESVRLYRALAAARPDAFSVEFGRSLWVLGNRKAETGDRDGGTDVLAEGLRVLTPVFAAYPAAVRGMIVGLARSYVACCEAAKREPDGARLTPIVAVLQRIEPAADAPERAASRERPAAPGFLRRMLQPLRGLVRPQRERDRADRP
jgi:tetratricopeptide (TPR) repeat protein